MTNHLLDGETKFLAVAQYHVIIFKLKAETSLSVIGQHLLQNPSCARKYNDGKFSILDQGRTAFISLPLKQLTSKHPNQIYGNKRNSWVA